MSAHAREELNDAWRAYRDASVGGPGAAAAAEVTRLKAAVVEARAAAATAAAAANTAKHLIDTLSGAGGAAAGSAPPPSASSADARAANARALADAKASYRVAHATMMEARGRAATASANADAALAALVEGFTAWHAAHGGGALSATGARRAGLGASLRSTGLGGVPGGEDALDEAEAFERLERDRVAAIDPDSLAFFAATKRLREAAATGGSGGGSGGGGGGGGGGAAATTGTLRSMVRAR